MKRMLHRSRAWIVVTIVVLTISAAYEAVSTAHARTRGVARKLFAGKITLQLPREASAPKKINSKAYQVEPKSSERRFVIYVTREQLRKDEVGRSNRQLASSIRATLEAQGYQVIKLTTKGEVFTADFTTYTDVPWQKVGTSAARGVAKFTRTRAHELIGTILLCDPRQWADSATKEFKRVVTSASVAR